MKVEGALLYFICFVALFALFWIFAKNKKIKVASAVLLVVILLVEIFVSNFHSFHLVFGGYSRESIDLSASNVKVEVDKSGSGQNTTDGYTSRKMTVTVSNIAQKVGTLYIECDMNTNADYINVEIDAKDVTQSASYRNNVAKGQIIRGDERSKYIVLDLSGDVSELRIDLVTESDATFTLRALEVNAPVPMRFSQVRLVVTALICFIALSFAGGGFLRRPYGERRKDCRMTAFVFTAVFAVFALVLTWLYQYEKSGTLWTGWANTSGNQITQELVDAFRQGQVSLLDKPSKELLAMDNPYDWSARSALGISYKWDHLLFDGKYYSYYGIAPVILLFLPYNLLTGYYFPTPEAVLIFGVIGIIFLTLTVLEFADMFCKKIPTGIILATLVIVQISSGIWYCFCSPLFYEIAQSSGFMFTCAGFYFLLKSRVIGEGQIKYRHVVLSTFCLAMAVLCRPTLALYCIVSLIFFAWGFFKHRRGTLALYPNDRKKLFANTTKYIVSVFVCYVAIGGAQILYNYARFGSFFDFGIQYSLTINDFTRSQYHTDFVMIGLYNYLVTFPKVQPEFPYVFSNFSTLNTNGYYFVANRNAVGLLWRALPTFGYFGSHSALKVMTKDEKRKALSLLIPTCIIVPLVIIFSIWESGYGVRYCVDFAWQMILGGCAVLYMLYCRVANDQTKRLIEKFFLISLVVAIAVNGAMIYDYMNKGGYLTAEFLRFERLFDFWI